MITLSEHIEYLITRHDCIVVPGWGAFIAQYEPAHFDTELGCIFPPSRTIGFNPSLQHNDGVVAYSVSRRHTMTYDNAVKAINDEVNTMHHQLEHDGEVALGKLGIFTRNEEGNPIFQPYKNTGFSPEFSGLIATKATPLLDKTRKKASAKMTADTFYVPVSRNIFKLVASIILLLGLGFTLTTPIVNDNANYASFSTVISSPKNQVTTFDIVQPDIDLAIAIPDHASSMAIADTTKSIAQPDPLTTHKDDSAPYCLVVASLHNLQEATKYINQQGNPDMKILVSGGRYRVYISTGYTVAEARQILNTPQYAGKHSDAWVCKR